MSIRSTRVWQWITLGAILGLLIAVGRLISASEQRIGGAGFISQAEFERGLRMPPLLGRPYLQSIVVHPGQEVDLVTLKQLIPETLTYRSTLFAAPRPYLPLGMNQPPNPDYTVCDFLSGLEASHAALSWRYGWWDKPVNLCLLCAAAGAVILGGLGLITRHSSHPREQYDVSRFKSEQVPNKEACVEQHGSSLVEIEAELDAGAPGAPLEAVIPVVELASEPVAPTPELPQESKDYAGEFYPVETRAPHGFSLSELVVVIGIIAGLVSLLLPTIRLARQQAQTVQCATQLRQLGQALSMYSQQNRGWLPAWSGWHTWPAGGSDDSPGPAWTIELMPYIGSPDSPVYHCPSFPGPLPCRNYFLAAQWSGQSHRNAMKLSDVTMTSRFVLSGDKTQLGLYPPPDGTGEHLSDDADPDDHGSGMPVLAWPWEPGGFYMHRGGNNILFDDMHVALFGRYDSHAMTFNPHRMENWADTTPD